MSNNGAEGRVGSGVGLDLYGVADWRKSIREFPRKDELLHDNGWDHVRDCRLFVSLFSLFRGFWRVANKGEKHVGTRKGCHSMEVHVCEEEAFGCDLLW